MAAAAAAVCTHCCGSGKAQRALAAAGLPLHHLLACMRPHQGSQYMQHLVEQQGLQGRWYCKRYDAGHMWPTPMRG